MVVWRIGRLSLMEGAGPTDALNRYFVPIYEKRGHSGVIYGNANPRFRR